MKWYETFAFVALAAIGAFFLLAATDNLGWIHSVPAPVAQPAPDTVPVVAVAAYVLPCGDTVIFGLRAEEWNLLKHGGSVVRKGKP